MSKASKLAPIDVDEANNNTSHNSEVGNVLGPLSPSATSFTPRFSMASRKSFTSEDYRREPEEAEGMEFRNVVPGQVAMVSVLSKFGEKGEKWKLKRVVADREGHQELEDLEEPSENDESAGKEETIGAEIQVNGKEKEPRFQPNAYTSDRRGIYATRRRRFQTVESMHVSKGTLQRLRRACQWNIQTSRRKPCCH